MPVFISYSHDNKNFVDKLALQLVHRNVNVWVDRWELSIGDSVIDKVQVCVPDDESEAHVIIIVTQNRYDKNTKGYNIQGTYS